MTPSDIATDITSSQNFGSVNVSTNYTYSYAPGVKGQTMDDSRTWD